MAVFDRQTETALKQIAKNGQFVDWCKEDNSAPTDEPWNSEETPELKTQVKICFLPLNQNDLATFGYANFTDVPQGAVKGLMGRVPFEVSLKDWVMRDGKKLNVDRVKVLEPNGEKILFTLVLKD